jgi:cytochrome P450
MTTYNPFDPAQVDDHHDELARLRRECPVAEVLPGTYYLARHDDVVAVSRDPATFAQGTFTPLDADSRHPDQMNLGETNPPFHTVVRRNLATALAQRRVQAFAPFVRSVCDQLVDRFAGRGEADLLADYAVPLPARVMGQLAGLPPTEAADARAYVDDFIVAQLQPDTDEGRAAAGRVEAFTARLARIVAERRRLAAQGGDQPDDLLATLLACRDDEGRPISDQRILTHLGSDILVGGVETTTHLVGNLFFQVLGQPGLWTRLRRDRRLVPAAVEESLRHMPPVQVVFRRATADAEVGGVAVPAGSVLVLGLSSANWDEAAFERPEAFDVDRPGIRGRHLAFNYGIHLCVGAALARLEGVCALEAVLDRFEDLALADGAAYEKVAFYMMRGPRRVPVVFTSR